ncbi:MAG TPA: sigma-70 family RNA polymerase sigma factor [Longimicrobiaceae bacterium]|nr:sigma-70 family RNA polymerase sigma factor [Longimicrobiaceae bacterium]
MIDETDAALVALIKRGDRAAAGKLAERYLRACRAIALSVVGDIHAAEDIAQDAFVHGIQRIDDCREPERFAGWLRQITRNRALNHLRDGKTRTREHQQVDRPEPVPSPAREAELSEIRERLLTALNTLPEDRREVVLLHDLEGWTHREIADRMNLPAGTVRSHLHYARRQLRSLLGTLDDQEG